jgi:uncharacterized protein (TIGR03083 family)
MTDRSLVQEKILSGQLLLQTEGVCNFDAEHLLEVWGAQRRRFAAVLQEFSPADWAAPTRCATWSAHDVVRHLCDGNGIGLAWVSGTDDGALDLTAGFDPRITPGRWPAASATESPGTTLGRFLATTEDLFAAARARLARRWRFDVRLPYGPMDWTVGALHGFWDSWLHERDVLLARGAEHPTNGDATAYATAYGVFIAAAVASMFADPVQQTLTLSGAGGGIYDLDSRGPVTLTVTQASTVGPPAAQVADALAGRAPVTAVLGDLPASSCTALSHMADFFNTPAEQAP